MTTDIDIYASNTMSYRDYALQHYGVKGMKWGVRKRTSNAVATYKKHRAERKEAKRVENHLRDYGKNRAPGYTDKQLRKDLLLYGANGAMGINARMNRGMDHKSASDAQLKETMKDLAIYLATAGMGKAVASGIEVLGTPEGKAAVLAGASAAGKIFRDMGIDSDKALGYAKVAKKTAKGVYKITSAR